MASRTRDDWWDRSNWQSDDRVPGTPPVNNRGPETPIRTNENAVGAAVGALLKDVQLSDSDGGYQKSGNLLTAENDYLLMECQRPYVNLNAEGKLHCNLCARRGDIGHSIGNMHCHKAQQQVGTWLETTPVQESTATNKTRQLQMQQLEDHKKSTGQRTTSV